MSSALRRLVLDRVERAIALPSLATSVEVLATPGAKAGLRARTGAGAVDMESAAILRRAAAAGIPALVVRAVSDTADEAVPAALGRLVTPDGRARAAQAVAALVTVARRAAGRAPPPPVHAARPRRGGRGPGSAGRRPP